MRELHQLKQSIITTQRTHAAETIGPPGAHTKQGKLNQRELGGARNVKGGRLRGAMVPTLQGCGGDPAAGGATAASIREGRSGGSDGAQRMGGAEAAER